MNQIVTMPDRCPFTKKVTYLSVDSANLAIRRMLDSEDRQTLRTDPEGMRSYRCDFYPHFHIGHHVRKPRTVVE